MALGLGLWGFYCFGGVFGGFGFRVLGVLLFWVLGVLGLGFWRFFVALGFRVLLAGSVPIVRFRCFNSVLRFGRVLHAKKKSLKCCCLQHFAVLALRAYFTATYYGKASGRQNALCALRSSFCRVCASFRDWGGGLGGGLIAPCLLFQLLANDVHACLYIYVFRI